MSGDQEQDEKVASMLESAGVNGTKASMSLKRAAKVDEVCFVDASKEGNVSRFINVSPADQEHLVIDQPIRTHIIYSSHLIDIIHNQGFMLLIVIHVRQIYIHIVFKYYLIYVL